MSLNTLEKYKCKHLEVMLKQAGNDSLGQAVLLIGPKFVGKKRWINKLIEEILGDQSDTVSKNPDVHWLETGAKVSDVRRFLQKLYIKPYNDNKVVGVIENIDQFTREGANTLLKTFEEPPESAILIFTASMLDSVLPTIQSRARIIQIPALDNEAIMPLIESLKWPCSSELVSWLSQGYPGYIEHWQNNSELLEQALRLVEEWNKIASENYSRRSITAKAWSEIERDTFNWVSLLWLRGILHHKMGEIDPRTDYLASLKNIAEIDLAWNNISLESINEAISEVLLLNNSKLSANQRKNNLEKILLTIL
ncbi:hypothetical protein ACFL1U_02440 [Patescibacteria group bacterium]